MSTSRLTGVSILCLALLVTGCTPVQKEKQTMKPDLSALFIEGAHHRHDSFTATLQAIARLFGQDSDYEQVYSLSTNGFAPVVHPPEGCKSTWMMHGRGQCLGLVADFLGLEATEIRFGKARPELAADESRPFWKTPEGKAWNADEAEFLRSEIKSAIESGAVVLTDGGWQHHYYLWGIIREVAADGRVVGTALDGPKDNELDHFRRVWKVTTKRPGLSPAAADKEMLRNAVLRIRGQSERFQADSEQECIWGLLAMDRWIEQMKKPAFQEDDPAASAWNARCCAAYSYDGANHVSSYLRRRLKAFPENIRVNIAATADCYDRIAQLLAPFAPDERAYEELFKDHKSQVKHADRVLTEVKSELEKAAKEIETALGKLSQQV